jgi:N-acylethanolamine-hydrolysing acid amidase
MKQSLPSELASLVSTLGEDIDKYMPYPYGQEIVGISNALTNTTVSDALLGNILYELTAYNNQKLSGRVKMCTSIVAQTVNGTIYHGRNLDYNFPDLLRDLTIIVDFQQGGQTVYSGTTFAGLIGLATAQKPHAYTISVNERNTGTWWMNVFEALIAGTHGITVLLVRDVVSNKEMDFESAVNSLANSHVIAPSYIIVGGAKPGEGVVITRDRTASKDLWRMNPESDNNTSSGSWYLVETNYDHWEPPPAGDDRRDPAIKAMDGTTRAGVNATSLFKVLSTPPVLNDGTTYTAVMSAAMPDIYNTWVRLDV